VAKLYPEIFVFYDQYCIKFQNFVDPTLQRFHRQVQFYIAYLRYIGRVRSAGLRFCYPMVGRGRKEIYGDGVFDLALAAKLAAEGTAGCSRITSAKKTPRWKAANSRRNCGG
jgi:DNA mismatch repair protein MutS